MKDFLKKHYQKIIFIIGDLLLLPCTVLCRYLSAWMLTSGGNECVWLRFGGQCITCGGTRFVNNFCSGRFVSAFMDNQYLFALAVYFLITVLFLNLYFVFGIKWSKRVLRWMYSIPSGIAFIVGFVVFMLCRNVGLMINLAKMVNYLITALL